VTFSLISLQLRVRVT